ncbi:MAG TPA: TlyA family RNA methyltransferase [Bryobacteraceae bacterium]|nr:TlyA family RNA methyltransferase [Bryobacteraceae bacterium]
MPAKQRLDVVLVERGLVSSREKAQALVLAGEVFIGGQKASKPGQPVDATSAIELRQPLRYVGRGGIKLEAGLDAFSVLPEGRVCLDVGTSTGGFTDCLLQHGAARVHCVDTGAGQIDWKLRNDPRVVLHERFNARYLKPADIGEPVSLIVCDVSFISVTLLLPVLFPLLTADGEVVILVKPQFEVGRENIGKGGIVRDPELQADALRRVDEMLASLGFVTQSVESPILGAEGNREFLLHGRR